MPLTPGQRVDLKKRVIAELRQLEPLDVSLVLDEFDFPPPELEVAVSDERWLRERVIAAADTELISLDAYLYPDDPYQLDPGVGPLFEDDDNTPFTAEQQTVIVGWIAEVKESAREKYSLSDDQMQVLTERLDYIEQALPRTGKLDWLNLTVGAVVSTVMTGVLTPGVTQGILQTLITSVGHFFGHPLPQLPGPIGA